MRVARAHFLETQWSERDPVLRRLSKMEVEAVTGLPRPYPQGAYNDLSFKRCSLGCFFRPWSPARPRSSEVASGGHAKD